MQSEYMFGSNCFVDRSSGRGAGRQRLARRSPSLVRGHRNRPNIVLIISDEHNAGVTGCYGNPIVCTPHLDRLAAEGVTFESCYCNSPLCVPSRLVLTAGKYVSRTGAWSNECWLPSDDYPSIARVMTAAGYDALLCGRMHYDRTRRYGFTEIGGVMNDAYRTGRGKRRRPLDLPGPRGISRRFAQFRPGQSRVLAHDRHVTDAACRFLQQQTPGERPFFLVVGYMAPHFPLIVPRPYWESYRGRVPMPNIPDGHLESLPLNYRHLRAAFAMEHVPEAAVQRGRELYYGLTQWLDEQAGKVLQSLAASQVADDTAVIYTSDHGENLGEHGLWWKNCMFEPSVRVPLIFRWPNRWPGGTRRYGVCSLVDVVQTIVELGGTEAPEDWNGHPLCRWMDDADAPWKDLAVSEYFGHYVASGFVMLRHGEFKYVYHTAADEDHLPERELYHLKNDPGELTNLASDPAHQGQIEQMHRLLVHELGEHPDEAELRCRADLTKGYDRPAPTWRPTRWCRA